MSPTMEDIRRLVLKRSEIKPACLQAGQRVRLSAIGKQCLESFRNVSVTGIVVKSSACYPDSVAVIRDGSKRKLEYHRSYWEAERNN